VNRPNSRKFIRTPSQQLLVLALAALVGIVLLMTALSMASGSTDVKAGVDAASKTITVSIATEPPQLDGSITADTISGFVLGHVMEGLLRKDENNNLVAGVADRWDITATGATFWIRKDAKWSDGKPVTAHDFVFAWRKVVDPATASEYANIMSPIRNADKVNSGKLPVTALGVQAVGDRELRVQFVKPVPYFAQLMAFNIFYPIREDFFNSTNGRYASSAETLLYNGPFKMTRWVHGAHIRMVKNPEYWDRDIIEVNAIDIPYFTSDPSAVINLFRDRQIALAPISQENLEEAQLLDWNMKSFLTGGVFYVEFNHRDGKITNNRNFRKALQYALNSKIEVNKVIKVPGYLPGKSLFPIWLDGANDKFRKEYPAVEFIHDRAKAREYLEKAKNQLGLKTIPPIMLLTGDNPQSNKIAEYYQDTLKRQLGLDVRIDGQIFKQRLAKMLAGDFDIVMTGWGPDYADPLTFGDLFMTGNVNNRGNYSSAAYDRQVRIAQNSTDPAVRAAAFGALQQIVFDDAVILLEYESALLYTVDPRITGVVRRVIGTDPDYTYVKFVKE
jgi:oligopeptide transport system substrate-binding protein